MIRAIWRHVGCSSFIVTIAVFGNNSLLQSFARALFGLMIDVERLKPLGHLAPRTIALRLGNAIAIVRFGNVHIESGHPFPECHSFGDGAFG